MNAKQAALYEARARVIKAMAHPTRLFIVDELSQVEERCVCELTKRIGTDMSTVSRHLTLLRDAGIIEDEKRGSKVFYRLRMTCVLRFLECIESVVANNARRHQSLVR